MEDFREEALESLSEEEMEAIKETFRTYDINGDGGISKTEMSELIRMRVQDRKAIIDEKYNQYLQEENVNDEDIQNAEHARWQYYQQLMESQGKLISMFEAADVNGDGIISFTEFFMAEAWWLRCSLNPEKCHLF